MKLLPFIPCSIDRELASSIFKYAVLLLASWEELRISLLLAKNTWESKMEKPPLTICSQFRRFSVLELVLMHPWCKSMVNGSMKILLLKILSNCLRTWRMELRKEGLRSTETIVKDLKVEPLLLYTFSYIGSESQWRSEIWPWFCSSKSWLVVSWEKKNRAGEGKSSRGQENWGVASQEGG